MKFTKIANRIVMYITGSILIVAGILKVHQLLTEPIISEGFWESWAFFVIQIPLELGLGVWLLCGLFRKAAWLLAVISFGGFIVVTLQKAVVGEVYCGCFGTVYVNLWITVLAIDVPIFLLLLVFRPKGEKLLPPPWPSAEHFFGVALPTFVILASIVPVLIFNKVERQTPWTQNMPGSQNDSQQDPLHIPDTNETAPDANQITVAEQQWAMLEHIDIADSLRSGLVIVLFYHDDCPDCKEAIPVYERYNQMYKGNDLHFAFVEIPPYGTEEDNPIPPDTTCLTGRLDTSRKWLIQTPLVVVIADGLFVKSWEGVAPDDSQIFESIEQE